MFPRYIFTVDHKTVVQQTNQTKKIKLSPERPARYALFVLDSSTSMAQVLQCTVPLLWLHTTGLHGE